MKIPTLTHNGFQKGGPAAEGSRPTFLEAAEGRLHYGGGWGFVSSFSLVWAIICHAG